MVASSSKDLDKRTQASLLVRSCEWTLFIWPLVQWGFSQYTTRDEDAEQQLEEENCGQRSLAWLCVYHVYGRR
jgi:hypothetical protein